MYQCCLVSTVASQYLSYHMPQSKLPTFTSCSIYSASDRALHTNHPLLWLHSCHGGGLLAPDWHHWILRHLHLHITHIRGCEARLTIISDYSVIGTEFWMNYVIVYQDLFCNVRIHMPHSCMHTVHAQKTDYRVHDCISMHAVRCACT